MLTIAGGIILAFFIMGLLEDASDTFLYWVFGAIIVWVIYLSGYLPTVIYIILGILVAGGICALYDKYTKKK